MKTGSDRTDKWWPACLLSFLLPGLGQVWQGRVGAGVVGGLFYCLLSVLLFLAPLHLFIGLGLLFVLRLLICADTVRGPRSGAQRLLRRWCVILVVGVAGTVGARYLHGAMIGRIEVVGQSMEPTLLSGDMALADRVVYRRRAPRRGEVVVFENPAQDGRFLVKRIVATAGQTVTVQGHRITVDGRPVADRRPAGDSAVRQEMKPADRGLRVPADHVYVLSDNLNMAPDSRYFGAIPAKRVRARLLKIYWSWDRRTIRARWARIGQRIL